MQYKTLGRTQQKVSVLGFGGAPAGLQGYLGSVDKDSPDFRHQLIDSIRAAVDGGVTYFDTAQAYGDGRSEAYFGEGLAGRRDDVVLATKYLFRKDWTPEQYTHGLHQSLERLKTDRIDVLQLHGNTWTDEEAEDVFASGVLDWVEDMRAQGLVRFPGITAEGPSGALERLLKTDRFDVIEIAYSLIYQAACDYQRGVTGIIPLARSLGMGVTTMRPATSGFLQKLLAAEFPDLDLKRLTRLAINFVLSTPEVDCAVVGMQHPDEVAANLALADDVTSRIDVAALHNRYDGKSVV